MLTLAANALRLTFGQNVAATHARPRRAGDPADRGPGRNAGDGHGYAADVGPDVSFTNLFGMVITGVKTSNVAMPRFLRRFTRGRSSHT